MPLDVRERLVDAASRAGRSLNAEIVHRLERSLEDESPNAARPSNERAGNSGLRESLEGRGMSRKRLRLGLVGLVALVLVAIAAIMGGLRGSTSSSPAAGAEVGEMPTALANHLATLRQAMPGNQGMSEEGPGGAADAAFLERAYPDTTISVAEMNGAREAFSDVAGVPYRAGEGDGRWETIGPSRALYPFTEFRNSFNYVPNDYVAGGGRPRSRSATSARAAAARRTSRPRAAVCGTRTTCFAAGTSTGRTSAVRSGSTPPAR